MALACPACTAPNLDRVSKFELHCSYCDSSFSGKPFICPACGWINAEEAEFCHDCGEPMDVISQVLSRKDQGEPQWLRRARSQASEIKSDEAEASQKRFEAFAEIDRRRKAAEFSNYEAQRERDRRIFFGVLVVFIVVVIILISLLVLQGQGSV